MSSDITEQDIEASLLTSKVGSPPLDILVRTSGVKRLSDFMLWQVRSAPSFLPARPPLFFHSAEVDAKAYLVQCCEDTQLHLLSTYWPDFDLWDFVPVILDYQRKVWARSSKASSTCSASDTPVSYPTAS